MTTQEIADRLIALCREGKYRQAQQELYSQDVRSLEPEGSMWPSTDGLAATSGKIDKWDEMVQEVHSMEVSDPIISNNFISCVLTNDITFNGMGRISGSELCVFEVKDGKVVTEQFFYPVA